MVNLFAYTFVFCGVFSSYVKASVLDDLKQKYVDMILQCSRNYPITPKDMELLKLKIMPDNESIKCLFACVYKNAGMMNERGELWVEGVNEMSRKYLSSDPTKVKKSEEFTEACKSVNDVPVSDGEMGCERAALIFKCTVEKSPEFEFI